MLLQEHLQLAQNSQQFFTGDNTVQQRLLRFAYISGLDFQKSKRYSLEICLKSVKKIKDAESSFKNKIIRVLLRIY